MLKTVSWCDALFSKCLIDESLTNGQCAIRSSWRVDGTQVLVKNEFSIPPASEMHLRRGGQLKVNLLPSDIEDGGK